MNNTLSHVNWAKTLPQSFLCYGIYLFCKFMVITLDVERKTRGICCKWVFGLTGYTGGERDNFGKKGLWIISTVDNPFTRDLMFSGGKEP